MSKANVNIWLKEGEQSKVTPKIRKICSKFKGDNLEKIFQALDWIAKSISNEKDYDKVINIFASRTADQLIMDKNDTGCHDTALVLVTFLRVLGIPAKYLVGIDKLSPWNKGHCVIECYVEQKWILIDPGQFQINLVPSRSHFYRNYYVVREGLDSWDCGIKTFSDWKKISTNLTKKLSENTIR